MKGKNEKKSAWGVTDVVGLSDNEDALLRTYLPRWTSYSVAAEVGPGSSFPLAVRGLSCAGLVLSGEMGLVPSLRAPGSPPPGARPPRQPFRPCMNQTSLPTLFSAELLQTGSLETLFPVEWIKNSSLCCFFCSSVIFILHLNLSSTWKLVLYKRIQLKTM